MPKKARFTTPSLVDGKLESDNKIKADILNEQFCSVFTLEDSFISPEIDSDSDFPPMPDIGICESGVFKLLKDLEPTKGHWPRRSPFPNSWHGSRGAGSSTYPYISNIFEYWH